MSIIVTYLSKILSKLRFPEGGPIRPPYTNRVKLYFYIHIYLTSSQNEFNLFKLDYAFSEGTLTL